MSLPRFFLPDQVVGEETEPVFALALAADDVKHAHVLRLTAGEHLAVVDAQSDYFECEIVDPDALTVRICGHACKPRPRPFIRLFQGLAKGDKLDDVFRHATELGVAEFVPLICARSVVKLDAKRTAKRLARWEAIVKSAAMQSGQPAIPQVCAPVSVAQVARLCSADTATLVCWEEERSCDVRTALEGALAETETDAKHARVSVVVGPEGGLAEEEVEAFRQAAPRARSITLGTNILRTETAGLVAPALVLYELGELR